MQISAKLKSKSTVWNAVLRPRVLDTVFYNSSYYANISGNNAIPTNTTHWMKIYSGSEEPITINKVAGNIGGSDPVFTLDLSGDGLPAYPKSMIMYVNLNGDDVTWRGPEPFQFNPTTKIMSGLNNPVDYPDQKIKILVS